MSEGLEKMRSGRIVSVKGEGDRMTIVLEEGGTQETITIRLPASWLDREEGITE